MANQGASDALKMILKEFIPGERNTGKDDQYPGALRIGELQSFDQIALRRNLGERVTFAEALKSGRPTRMA